jgi:hypothetical protein
VYFELDVPGPPAAISGTYDVTLAVDPTCGGFPSELLRRTFATTIVANRGSFNVHLSGSAFVGDPIIYGGIAGNEVAFWLEGFAEQLSPNSFLIYAIVPTATIESSPLVIDAAGSGVVTYCQLRAVTGPVNDCYRQAVSIYNACHRENHRLTFTRK